MDGFQEGSTPNSYDKSLEAQEGTTHGLLHFNGQCWLKCLHILLDNSAAINDPNKHRMEIYLLLNNNPCIFLLRLLGFSSPPFQLSTFKHLWYWPGKTGRSPKGPLVGEMPLTMQSNRKLICSLSADASRKTPAPVESRLHLVSRFVFAAQKFSKAQENINKTKKENLK